MYRLSECISESSETIIDTTGLTNMTNLMEQQLESHDRVNYKVIELKITFVLISSSAKQGSNREVITVSERRKTIDMLGNSRSTDSPNSELIDHPSMAQDAEPIGESHRISHLLHTSLRCT